MGSACKYVTLFRKSGLNGNCVEMHCNALIMFVNAFSTFLNEFMKCGQCSKMFMNALVMFLNALATFHDAREKCFCLMLFKLNETIDARFKVVFTFWEQL